MSVSAISPLFSVLSSVSITLSNILSWTVCLPGLFGRFGSKKRTDPKKVIEWKKCIKSSKKHPPAHTKHNSAKKLILLCEATVWTIISHPKKCLGAHFYTWLNSSFCRPFVISKSCKDMQLLESCKLLRSCEPTMKMYCVWPCLVAPNDVDICFLSGPLCSQPLDWRVTVSDNITENHPVCWGKGPKPWW